MHAAIYGCIITFRSLTDTSAHEVQHVASKHLLMDAAFASDLFLSVRDSLLSSAWNLMAQSASCIAWCAVLPKIDIIFLLTILSRADTALHSTM
jgi:hypothetical protein